MSQDICRGDWRLDFCGFVFKQLSNITNNNFGKVKVSKNYSTFFFQQNIQQFIRYILLILVY